MNVAFSQTNRLGHLATVLGDDALVLLRFDGTDYINNLFEYNVEALAATPFINFDELIGTHATVTLEGRSGAQQFDGIVTQAKWVGAKENGHCYKISLRPWLWLAGQRTNQRIFHHKTVVQILNTLFADYAGVGNPAVEFRLFHDYPVLEYTVQYRETDLNFARRLMEGHGISFHFEHQKGNHVMVITDDVISHVSVGSIPFKSYDGHHQADGEHFWEWAPERNLTTGAVRLIDYNFKTPTAAMEAETVGDAAHAFGQLESYEYPGNYVNLAEGNEIAQRRLKQFRGGDTRNRAVGDCLSLSAGKLFDLTGDPVPGQGQRYLCLKANHSFKSEAYGTGSTDSDTYSYIGNYVFLPDTAPMAPPRQTPSPVVEGPQTGVVVGDDEIDCDEYGRVLVRFHWDLAGDISMRCRVRQNWAGNGLGDVMIPRVGMEVMVDFIDGDPSKPVVTGCVVNATNQAIHSLPVQKTKTSLKTKTHNGTGYNELSFQDAKGSEEIFVHAEKDMIRVIKDNEATTVKGGNRAVTVQSGSETKTIQSDRTLTVKKGNDTTTIETGDRTRTVQKGNDTTTIATGNRTVTVQSGNETKTIASGNLTENVAQTLSMSANAIVQTATQGNGGPGTITLNATNTINMSSADTYSLSGTNSFTVASKFVGIKGQTVNIEGENTITLTVGGSSITLTPDAIILKNGGSKIVLNDGNIIERADKIQKN